MEEFREALKNYQWPQNMAKYEQDNYNNYQNYLYKRALYGLSSITEEELTTMCSKKKQRIVNVYKKAQITLNRVKQEITIKQGNLLFQWLLPESPITAYLFANSDVDDKVVNTLTFKDLSINKQQIITIFIEKGVLPKNFLSLTGAQNKLPRLKGQM